MRRFVAALLALLAACSPASWTDESPDALKAVHDAVFDVYFPVDVLPIDDVIKRGANHFWSERLASWGYVTLVVDSFTARGMSAKHVTATRQRHGWLAPSGSGRR